MCHVATGVSSFSLGVPIDRRGIIVRLSFHRHPKRAVDFLKFASQHAMESQYLCTLLLTKPSGIKRRQ